MTVLPSMNVSPAAFWSFFGRREPVSSAVTKPTSPLDAAKVVAWIGRLDAALPRLERTTEHGAYPLLQKEIQEITPLLAEGRAIASASTTALLGGLIDTVAKPSLARLITALTVAQTKLAANPEIREKDAKVVEKWKKLKLPESILENHIDCARFLMESGLAFEIVGYRETCRDPAQHDVQLANDGMPMIKVQGAFKRWDLIKRELVYDEKTEKIRSQAYPGQVVQSWTYLNQGLVPIDRLNNSTMVPIYRLSQTERQRVVDHARKFYETNREVDQGIPKDWVLQFHTSPRRQFVASIPPLPDTPLLDNIVRNLNTHIVMRLIAPSGDVYSFGIEMPADSKEFLWENTMAKMLGTVTAKINKAGDYEEFRTHVGRLVTGVPLTAQRADNIIQMVNSSGDIRFNFLRQSCLNLMNIVMKMAGYDAPPALTTVKEFFADLPPDVKHIPYIGCCLDKINRVFQRIASCISWATPGLVKKIVLTVSDIALYVPRKVNTVAVNLLIKYKGGATMLHALPQGTEDEEFYQADRFLNFSRLIRSWKDLFREQTQEVYHSKYFIDWQKQQHSTFLEPGAPLPKLAVVPPAP